MQFYMQSEKVSHQQTCSALERERDRARLAEAELAILRRQLHREKATFENALVIHATHAHFVPHVLCCVCMYEFLHGNLCQAGVHVCACCHVVFM